MSTGEVAMIRLRRVVAAALVAAPVAMASGPAPAQDVTLEFVVWNYSLDTNQDNVRQFEEQNPGIRDNATDYPWPDYPDSPVLRLAGCTTTDRHHVGPEWLPAST